MWVFFIPIVIIMKIEVVPSPVKLAYQSLLCLQNSLYLINEHRRGIYLYDFFPIVFTISSRSYETPCT